MRDQSEDNSQTWFVRQINTNLRSPVLITQDLSLISTDFVNLPKLNNGFADFPFLSGLHSNGQADRARYILTFYLESGDKL